MNTYHALAFGKPKTHPAQQALIVGLLLVPLAVLLGGLIAINNLIFAGALMAAIALPIAVFAHRALFWTSIVGSLVLVGLIELYLPSLVFLRYLFLASAALFFVSVLIRQFGPSARTSVALDPVSVAALVFLLSCGVTQIINWHGVTNALPGLKNYFQAWGVFLGLALMTHWSGFDRRLPKLLLGIALIQLPFALHQFLFIAPNRYGVGNGIVAVDVVSGTLGGNVGGGGQNAFLALVLSSVTGVLLSLWRTGALKAGWLLVMLPFLLLPLLLNSSRAAAIYAVFVFILVFRREILKRPLRVIAGAAGLAAAGALLLASYYALDQAQWGNRYSSLGQMVEEVVRKQTDSTEGYGGLELNRTTALTFWASQQPRYSVMHTLFGNGMSQAKEGDGKTLDNSNNLANRKYPGMGIGLTTAASLLWDLGVIGFAATFGMLVTAYFQAGGLAGAHRNSPYHAGLFEGLQAALVLVALSFFHKNSFTFHLGYQVFLLTILGFLAYARRRLPLPETTAKA